MKKVWEEKQDKRLIVKILTIRFLRRAGPTFFELGLLKIRMICQKSFLPNGNNPPAQVFQKWSRSLQSGADSFYGGAGLPKVEQVRLVVGVPAPVIVVLSACGGAGPQGVLQVQDLQ
jgi:hypothetical protein